MAPSKPSAPPQGRDIRAFFGTPSGSNPKSTPASQPSQPRKSQPIQISDDEGVDPPKKPTVPPKTVQKVPTTKPPVPVAKRPTTAAKPPPPPAKPPQAAKKATPVTLAEDSDEEIFQPMKNMKRKMALVDSSDEDAPSPPKKKPTPIKPSTSTPADSAKKPRSSLPSKPETPQLSSTSAQKRKKPAALAFSDEEDDASPPKKKPAVASSSKPANGGPRASIGKGKSKREDRYESETSDAEDLIPKKGATSKKKTHSAAKKDPVKDTKDKPEGETKKKFNWAAAKAAKLAAPAAHGTKDVPNGEEDCLAGLSFVFTGELSSFSRDEAVDIAKRYGGRVVGQPSSKTDYVVLGDNAGPAKIAAIKKHEIKTLSEDEFLNLVATRKSPKNGKGMDEKMKKKKEKEEADIKAGAKAMEKREKEAVKENSASGIKSIDPSTQLWTARYAPQSLKDICGNKTQIEKLQLWLSDWPKSLACGFKKPGKNAMNMNRAVLITGSPGIGKTTSAHLCAQLAGYTPIELNASDARSKKLVENGMNVNNTSLDGFITGGSKTNAHGITITDKTCLIMDEVDGMSAGDRGGVGALNALIKKTKIPIICIANDAHAQKLKPLQYTTYNLKFAKPQAIAIRSRILTIAFKEKMKVPANVIDQLVASSQSDIRQVVNMLSTWKLTSDTMSFDESKNLAKMNEKYTIMSPFDITSKMLGPYLFSHTARESLGDKMELYFQDHSFVPLFIQENYLKGEPAKLRSLDGPDKILTQLRLMDKAASSISDGDLVDGQIHGPEQHWSLMPLHAVCSAVRPASFLYGTGAHFGGQNPITFPQWLGQNSKQSKLSRQLTDVQIRMRLKVSGNKEEIRQMYIPALHPHIVKPLVDVGAAAIEQVIERMDQYYLTKEDWDTIVELGVDEHKEDVVLKKISGSIKGSFTRRYNASEHPVPFNKQELGKAPKKLAAGPTPDIEDAFDMDEVIEDASDDEKKPAKSPDDITGDKLIQTAKKAQAKGKGKAKK